MTAAKPGFAKTGLAKPGLAKTGLAKPGLAKRKSAKSQPAPPTAANPVAGKPHRRRQQKPVLIRDALRLELAAIAYSDPTAVRALAQRLWAKAAKGGHVQATREIATLLDGPPPAAPKPSKDTDPPQIDRIERVIVYPPARSDDPKR